MKRLLAAALAAVVLAATALAGCWWWMAYCPHEPLGRVDAADPELARRLETHVRALADRIGPRCIEKPDALAAAHDYIRQSMQRLGLQPVSQPYEVKGVVCRNLELDLPGTAPAERPVLVGAHYDTVAATPGADDNASSVAALLEMARRFQQSPCKRTVRLVAFTNEEDPYFGTDQMGSAQYARMARQRGDELHAMISLDAIGYYSDRPGSQRYPDGVACLFPDTGNFISVVGNLANRDLTRRFHSYLAGATAVPGLCTATFEWIEGIDWSDHQSFWKLGYPALMVTNTAVYRHPGYHNERDTSDSLDYPRFTRVTAALMQAIARLANE